jgi:hypothetical protein
MILSFNVLIANYWPLRKFFIQKFNKYSMVTHQCRWHTVCPKSANRRHATGIVAVSQPGDAAAVKICPQLTTGVFEYG